MRHWRLHNKYVEIVKYTDNIPYDLLNLSLIYFYNLMKLYHAAADILIIFIRSSLSYIISEKLFN